MKWKETDDGEEFLHDTIIDNINGQPHMRYTRFWLPSGITEDRGSKEKNE